MEELFQELLVYVHWKQESFLKLSFLFFKLSERILGVFSGTLDLFWLRLQDLYFYYYSCSYYAPTCIFFIFIVCFSDTILISKIILNNSYRVPACLNPGSGILDFFRDIRCVFMTDRNLFRNFFRNLFTVLVASSEFIFLLLFLLRLCPYLYLLLLLLKTEFQLC